MTNFTLSKEEVETLLRAVPDRAVSQILLLQKTNVNLFQNSVNSSKTYVLIIGGTKESVEQASKLIESKSIPV